jgi:protein tyrosine phosphatase (PTP) superfamily phosphohydrolase (DUF442 family)
MRSPRLLRWFAGGGWKRHVLIAAALVAAGAAAAGAFWLQEHFERRVGRFAEVVPGVLYRSEQPHGGQWQVLRERGIRTVIDLRPPEEDPRAYLGDQKHARATGMRFVSIPISEELPGADQVERFLREARAGPPGVLVHCELGRSRTGYMLAAYLVAVEAWTPEAAVDYIRDTGASLGGEKLPHLYRLLEDLSQGREEWLRRTAPDTQPSTAPQPNGAAHEP